MTKTTKPQRRTAEQIDAGWRAIEHLSMGPRERREGVERIEIGSADSGFDAPPSWPPAK